METMHTKPKRAGNGYSDNIVAFQLAKQTFALPLDTVVQIIPMLKLTPLPHVHPAVAGVMNFRGSAVPIINMRRYLGMEVQAPQLHTPILLVRLNGESNSQMAGLIVDEVQDVVSIPESEIIELKDMIPTGLGDVPILQGMLHTQEGATLLLDIDQLFAAGPLQDMRLINPDGNGSAFTQDDYGMVDRVPMQQTTATQES